MHLYPEQCRAARGLLNWTQEELASFSGVSRSTIKDFECHRHSLHRSSETLIVTTFESRGVQFFDGDGETIGLQIRLADRSGADAGGPTRISREARNT